MPPAMTPASNPQAGPPRPPALRARCRSSRRAVAACALAIAVSACASDRATGCAPPGTWFDPTTRQEASPAQLFASLAARPIVLLGEEHDNADHHRWQLHVIETLHAIRPDLVLGFEMFTRSSQTTLDRWVAGEIEADAFLKETRWAETWGFDSTIYQPLFEFARRHKVPMLALNVERTLIARVARQGLAAVPVDAREGVGNPAPALPAYRRRLAEVFAQKRRMRGTEPPPATSAPDLSAEISVSADPGFERFIEAQLTWDRAMAEALAAAHAHHPSVLLVALAGTGHLEHGLGIPHQLRSLGIDQAAALLPAPASTQCADLPQGVADAVWLVD